MSSSPRRTITGDANGRRAVPALVRQCGLWPPNRESRRRYRPRRPSLAPPGWTSCRMPSAPAARPWCASPDDKEAVGLGACLVPSLPDPARSTTSRSPHVSPAGRDALQRVRLSIGRLEDEIWEISGKMNDVLARAACDFEDDALRRQDITKDTENEIAIAQCCRGMLAGVVHHPHAFGQLGPQNSPLGKSRRNRRMSVGVAGGLACWPRTPSRLVRFQRSQHVDPLMSRKACRTSRAVACALSRQKLVSLIPRCRASCRRRHEPCVAQSMPTPGTIMLNNGRMCCMLR